MVKIEELPSIQCPKGPTSKRRRHQVSAARPCEDTSRQVRRATEIINKPVGGTRHHLETSIGQQILCAALCDDQGKSCEQTHAHHFHYGIPEASRFCGLAPRAFERTPGTWRKPPSLIPQA